MGGVSGIGGSGGVYYNPANNPIPSALQQLMNDLKIYANLQQTDPTAALKFLETVMQPAISALKNNPQFAPFKSAIDTLSQQVDQLESYTKEIVQITDELKNPNLTHDQRIALQDQLGTYQMLETGQQIPIAESIQNLMLPH